MVEPAAQPDLRETGIPILGPMPWGTHLCQFYETKEDLLEAMVPYFQAGLRENEFCLWIISQPLTVDEAKAGLKKAVPDLEQRLAARSIEILPHRDWYLEGGHFDLHRVIAKWEEKLKETLARTFDGMRASANTSWLHKDDWREFREYEMQLALMTAGKRMIVSCTYQLEATPAAKVFEFARSFEVAVVRRCGEWEVVETPAMKKAKREIEENNAELEQRIRDRTEELEAANQELHALSQRLMQVREDERRHLARELHDHVGQLLTSVKITLQSVQQALGAVPPAAQLEQSLASLDQLIEEVHRIAVDLRSPLLDDLGLVPALRGFLVETAKQSGLEIAFKARANVPRFDTDIETACFRIVQEAMTNILRHARARSVLVELSYTENAVTTAVRDDGAGFDVEAARRKAREGTALGLLGMQERAGLLGGKLTIRSTPGEGTEVRVSFPLTCPRGTS